MNRVRKFETVTTNQYGFEWSRLFVCNNPEVVTREKPNKVGSYDNCVELARTSDGAWVYGWHLSNSHATSCCAAHADGPRYATRLDALRAAAERVSDFAYHTDDGSKGPATLYDLIVSEFVGSLFD